MSVAAGLAVRPNTPGSELALVPSDVPVTERVMVTRELWRLAGSGLVMVDAEAMWGAVMPKGVGPDDLTADTALDTQPDSGLEPGDYQLSYTNLDAPVPRIILARDPPRLSRRPKIEMWYHTPTTNPDQTEVVVRIGLTERAVLRALRRGGELRVNARRLAAVGQRARDYNERGHARAERSERRGADILALTSVVAETAPVAFEYYKLGFAAFLLAAGVMATNTADPIGRRALRRGLQQRGFDGPVIRLVPAEALRVEP